MSGRLPDWWPAAGLGAAALAAVVWLGATSSPTPLPTSDDRLGPFSGTSFEEYSADARASLDRIDDDAPRWGLVSLTEPVPASEVAQWFAEPDISRIRVSRVFLRVPFDRVSVPILAVGVPADPAVIARTPGVAAADWSAMVVGGGGTVTDRAKQTYELGRARLAEDCACVIAVTVRGVGDDLRALAGDPRVRAVEALQADAMSGLFAVSPLIPGQDVAGPVPDDGALPAQ